MGSLWVLAACGSLSLPAMAQQAAGDADARYNAALSLAGGKKWAEAAPALEKLLADLPMHPKAAAARLRLGEAYLALKKPELAVKTYEPLLAAKLPPDLRAEALLGIGRSRLALGESARAIPALQELFGAVEKSALLGPTAATLLGDALAAEGRYKEAAPVFDRFAQWPKDAGAPHAALMAADAYRLSGDPAEAVAGYVRLLEQFGASPLVPRALMGKGEALLQLARYEEAEGEFRRVLSQYGEAPEAPRAQLSLGRAAYLRGAYAVARAAFDAATILFPKAGVAAEAELRVADCYAAEKNVAEARARYGKLAVSTPGEVGGEAYLALGRLEQGEGQLGKALDAYGKAAALPGAGRWAAAGKVRLADLRLRAGDVPGAISLSREALAGKPTPDTRDEASVVLSEALVQKGDPAGAEGELASVLSRGLAGPVLDRAEAAFARCRLERGDSATALARCAALLKREPAPETQAEALATLGAAQLAAKNEAAALVSLRTAVDRHAGTPGGARAGKLLIAHYRATARDMQAREVEAVLTRAKSPGVVLAAEMLQKAGTAARTGSHAEAIKLFGQVLDGGADRERRLQARAGIVDAAAHLRRPADVTAQLAEISKDQPPTGFLAQTALRASKVLEAEGDRSGALSVLRTARPAVLDPASGAEVTLALARILTDQGQGRDADPLLREVIRTGAKASQAEAAYALAWLCLEAGQRDEAMSLFARLSAEHPEHRLAADARFRLGEREYEAGHYTAAAEHYRAALRGNHPAADRVAFRLGGALREAGEHAEAAEAFVQAAGSKAAALAVESRVRAGEELLLAGKPEEALRQLEPVLAEETLAEATRLQARSTAAQAYNKLKQPGRTLEVTQPEPAGDDWYAARLLLARAEAVRKQSGAKAAATLYGRIAGRFTLHADVAAEAGYRAGECRQAAGDTAGARSAWEHVAQLFPESRWAEQSRKRLDDRRNPTPRAGK